MGCVIVAGNRHCLHVSAHAMSLKAAAVVQHLLASKVSPARFGGALQALERAAKGLAIYSGLWALCGRKRFGLFESSCEWPPIIQILAMRGEV